jgi:proteic killer suppression protein
MDLSFKDDEHDRLETDGTFTHGLRPAVVEAYRSRLQLLRAASNDRDLIAMRCLRLKALPKTDKPLYSIHLIDQYRLIIALDASADEPCTRALVVGVEESRN